MNITIYLTLAIILATYWLTSAVVYSAGPKNILFKLRHKYEFLECFICVSMWAAIATTLVAYLVPELVYIMAIAGGALLLDKLKR